MTAWPGDTIAAAPAPGPTNDQPPADPDYVIATAGIIAHEPATVSDIDAGSLPGIAVTAWQGLFE